MEEDYKAQEGEETVYDEDTREDMIDNDEISPEEEAFMKGYDEAEEKKKKAEESPDEQPE